MKLLSIELFGQYKGLKDQVFDFSTIKGDVAVLTLSISKTQLFKQFCSRQKRCRRDGLYRVAGSSNLLDREKTIHAYAVRFK